MRTICANERDFVWQLSIKKKCISKVMGELMIVFLLYITHTPNRHTQTHSHKEADLLQLLAPGSLCTGEASVVVMALFEATEDFLWKVPLLPDSEPVSLLCHE